jgi:cardiolipin synthase A/B
MAAHHHRHRHPRIVSLLKVVAVIVVIVGTVLAFAQDQETVELRSALPADDPRAPDYLAALVASHVTSGNDYDILNNGDDVYPAMLQAINEAHERISFETYVYEKGEVADLFTEALERAARRGVRVNIVIDFVGAGNMDDDHVERLEKAGCIVVDFNPTHWYSLEELNYRTHRKILVVDGMVAFTGGIGVADFWLGHAQDADHWRDTQVRIRGPIVRLLEAAFYENFIESEKTVTPVIPDITAGTGADDRSMLVRSAPSEGASDLKRLYLLVIAMARRSIDITSPYFLTDESTKWAFTDAIRRGVKVRVLVESDITDQQAVKYASREAYDGLMQLGIEIYEYQPTMIHSKVIVADGIVSVFGSANFDNRSLELNDELNVVVFSRSLAARFAADFDKDLRSTKRLQLEEWRKRSFMEKTHEQFWSYFGEVF